MKKLSYYLDVILQINDLINTNLERSVRVERGEEEFEYKKLMWYD